MLSPDTNELSDAELLVRFNDGDAAAFEVLLGRYKRPIYNFILRSVRRRDHADELLQDVFLRVIQRSKDFKGQSKFSTWLYTIARNLCIDHSRKQSFRRHRSLDAPMRGGHGEEGPSLLDRVQGKGQGADREAIAGRVTAKVAEAVEDLPEEQREVFLMRQLQGLPFKEIAAIVGVPENTVKSRMRYALERLQGALSEYEDYARNLK
ncbi:MAG: RNA polymerase sigma factor [Deltaproteobacteria bacterium]|nr:MAG: RNA polymerase sigma factor [Deltaproteobacteria bacterium]